MSSDKYWEIYDENKQRPYYFEVSTKKSTWKKPVGDHVQIIPMTLEEIKRQKMQKKQPSHKKSASNPVSIEREPVVVGKKGLASSPLAKSNLSASIDQSSEPVVAKPALPETSSASFLSLPSPLSVEVISEKDSFDRLEVDSNSSTSNQKVGSEPAGPTPLSLVSSFDRKDSANSLGSSTSSNRLTYHPTVQDSEQLNDLKNILGSYSPASVGRYNKTPIHERSRSLEQSQSAPPTPLTKSLATSHDNLTVDHSPSTVSRSSRGSTLIVHKDVALAPGWFRLQDEETKEVYYANPSTGQVTWSRAEASQTDLTSGLSAPEGLKQRLNIHSACTDPHSIQKYFGKQFIQSQEKFLIPFIISKDVQKTFKTPKDPISMPLLKKSKPETKSAVQVSKHIFSYLKKGDNNEIISLLLLVKSNPILADEVYCQLIKHLTKSGDLIKIWEIFVCCSCSFLPDELYSFVTVFFQANLGNENSQALYARCCLRKHAFLKTHALVYRAPTPEDVEKFKNSPNLPSVFGSSLDEIMVLQKAAYPTLTIPVILTCLTDRILKTNGLATEGIFRVPGDQKQMAAVREQLEEGNYELSETDPHVLASLLKQWFRDLTDPVIPHKLTGAAMQAADSIEQTISFVEKLPTIHQKVLKFTIRFLQIVADPNNQSKTKMTVTNLSVVFAPTILHAHGESTQEIITQANKSQKFLKTLIVHLKI